MFVYSLLDISRTNKNMSLLVLFVIESHPSHMSTQVELTMFVFQVNKAYSSLIQPSSCRLTAVAERGAGGEASEASEAGARLG